MKMFLKKFVRDESGLAAVEYAIVGGLVVSGLVAVFNTIGVDALARLTSLANAI